MSTEFFKLEIIQSVIKDMEETNFNEFSLDTIISRLRRKNFENGSGRCPNCVRSSFQFHDKYCAYRNLS